MNFESRKNLAVDSVLIEGRSVADTAMRYGIRSSQIWEWLEAEGMDVRGRKSKRMLQRLADAEGELHRLKIKIGLMQSEIARCWSAERL
jgi:transposase-like protein